MEDVRFLGVASAIGITRPVGQCPKGVATDVRGGVSGSDCDHFYVQAFDLCCVGFCLVQWFTTCDSIEKVTVDVQVVVQTGISSSVLGGSFDRLAKV